MTEINWDDGTVSKIIIARIMWALLRGSGPGVQKPLVFLEQGSPSFPLADGLIVDLRASSRPSRISDDTA